MYENYTEQYRYLQSAALRSSYLRIPRATDATLRQVDHKWFTTPIDPIPHSLITQALREDPISTLQWLASCYGVSL